MLITHQIVRRFHRRIADHRGRAPVAFKSENPLPVRRRLTQYLPPRDEDLSCKAQSFQTGRVAKPRNRFSSTLSLARPALSSPATSAASLMEPAERFSFPPVTELPEKWPRIARARPAARKRGIGESTRIRNVGVTRSEKLREITEGRGGESGRRKEVPAAGNDRFRPSEATDPSRYFSPGRWKHRGELARKKLPRNVHGVSVHRGVFRFV